MSKSEKLAWGLTAAVIGFPVVAVFRGFVLAKLWFWFVASQFGLPALSYPQALGIALLISLVSMRSEKADSDDPPGAPIVRGICFTLAALFIGWLYSLFL